MSYIRQEESEKNQNMYWSNVIIASLVAAPTFAQQRLGGPELLMNVEMVGEGKVIDIDSFGEEGVWLVGSRKVDVDSHQQDGAGASEKNVEDVEVIEVESVQLPQEIGFFDLAPHLNPEYLATLTAEDRSGLFGYIGDDVEEVERRLGSSSSCGDGKTSFLLEIKPDQDNLDDNEFKVFIGQSTSSMSQIMKKGSFNSANTVTAGMCAPQGYVKVVATDASGDGMKNGSYTVYLGGYIVATSPGTDKWSERVHTLDTASASSNSVPPPTPQPTPQPVSSDAVSGRNTCFEPSTSEEQDYLDAHNQNRKTYHQMLGAEYKPLTWSTQLASEASNYAQSLLQYCCTSQLPHDSSNIGKHGENLASNCGSGSYGQRKAATDILNRWVYMEHNKDSYTAKFHYTQALWRASDYVGCGVATKDMGNGAACYMQVCRYQKPGNCAINQDNHIMRMLSDSSGCAGVDVSC